MSCDQIKRTAIANAAIPVRRAVQGVTSGTVRRVIEATLATVVGGQDILGICEDGASGAGVVCAVVVQGLASFEAGAAGVALGVRLLTVDTATGNGRLVAAVAGDQVVGLNVSLRALAATEAGQCLVAPGNF